MPLHPNIRRSALPSRHQDGYVEARGTRRRIWYGHYYIYVRADDGSERRLHRGVELGERASMRKWEAEEALRRVILSQNASRSVADPSATFAWFVENRFLPMRSARWAPATDKGNRDDITRYLFPTLGARKLGDIDPFACQLLVNRLADAGRSSAVVARARIMLKSIFELAVELDFLRKNPARFVALPQNCVARPSPVIGADVLRRLLGAITDQRDHLVMMIGVFCAVRASELFGLKWSSYTGDALLIHSTAWRGKLYDRTKTKGSRAPIYLPQAIREELDLWSARRSDPSPDALLFPTANGTPLEARNFLRDCVRPIAAKLGIADRLTFQILRRSAGTRVQKHGTMKDIQAHLRHGSIETTADIYVQPIPESIKRMVEADVSEVLTTIAHRKPN